MEPITAVGFAAAVVQLLHFSIKSVETLKQVREKGSSADVDTADYLASQISRLSESVRTSLQLDEIHRTLSSDEKNLLNIGSNCRDCSEELLDELQKLKLDDDARPLQRIKIGAKTILKKERIVKLQEQLGGYREVLESGLLFRLG